VTEAGTIARLHRRAWQARKRATRVFDERFRRLETGPPDFVGVGAQRSGTSRWQRLIREHPGVWSPIYASKERHFFDALAATAPGDIAPAAYHRLFRRPPGQIMGEWTTEYMFHPWALPQLAAVAPDARLLVLLRDPVDRYASGRGFYLHRGETDLAAIEEKSFARGLYADQLDRVFAHYARDRVLVLQYERCSRDAKGELRRTYRFLGLDDSFLPADLDSRVNATRWANAGLQRSEQADLNERYRPQLERLESLLPEFDFSLWPSTG